MRIKQPEHEALDVLDFIKGIKQTCKISDLQPGVQIYIPRCDDSAVITNRLYKATINNHRVVHLIEAESTTYHKGMSVNYILTTPEATRCYIEKSN